MTKIKDIHSAKLINGHCAINITDRFNRMSKSGIIVGDVNYNKDVHAIRYGTIARLPDRINWRDAYWQTDVFPEIGDEVWFDYLDASDAEMVECGNDKYILLPFFRLILARSPKKGIIPLNGNLIAKKHPKSKNTFSIIDEYYNDIYDIVYAGKPNLWYKPEINKYGSIEREYVDDETITEGMTVMTRLAAYPILEEKLHAVLDKDNTYYYFQRREVVAEIKDAD